MSAPTSHDPLVVNTQDGTCWLRRAVTREGRGLYALADAVAGVPDEVLATLAELAEHGLASMADALPMPVGPQPEVDAAPWGRGEDGRPLLPMGAHWTDVPELVDQHLAGIQARVDEAQSGSWYVSPAAAVPGTVCTRVDGYNRTVGQLTNVSDADRELVLHAHSDLAWCLEMVAGLRGRVAELEAAAYGDATVRLLTPVDQIRHLHACVAAQMSRADTLDRLLREKQERIVELEAQLDDAPVAVTLTEKAAESADKLTALFAPTQVLREDPHDGPLRHDYRLGRDLPETGGAR